MKRRADLFPLTCPACKKVRIMVEAEEGDFSFILCIVCMKKIAENIIK